VAINLPAPDNTRLRRAPLELVIFQIRYDPQLRVSDPQVALAVHEAIGGRGGAFPNIEPINTMSVQFSLAGSASGVAAPVVGENAAVQGWQFSSGDATWVVQLTRDYASVQTTRYETWDDSFQPRVTTLIEALQAHVGPRVEQRLGLRYVDRLRLPGVNSPADWRPFLIAELLGLAGHPILGPAVAGAQQQVVLDLGDSVQCGFRHGFLREPTAVNEMQYFLDYDVFRQAGRAFDARSIERAADDFNTRALQLFQASVTHELMERFR